MLLHFALHYMVPLKEFVLNFQLFKINLGRIRIKNVSWIRNSKEVGAGSDSGINTSGIQTLETIDLQASRNGEKGGDVA